MVSCTTTTKLSDISCWLQHSLYWKLLNEESSLHGLAVSPLVVQYYTLRKAGSWQKQRSWNSHEAVWWWWWWQRGSREKTPTLPYSLRYTAGQLSQPKKCFPSLFYSFCMMQVCIQLYFRSPLPYYFSASHPHYLHHMDFPFPTVKIFFFPTLLSPSLSNSLPHSPPPPPPLETCCPLVEAGVEGRGSGLWVGGSSPPYTDTTSCSCFSLTWHDCRLTDECTQCCGGLKLWYECWWQQVQHNCIHIKLQHLSNAAHTY